MCPAPMPYLPLMRSHDGGTDVIRMFADTSQGHLYPLLTFQLSATYMVSGEVRIVEEEARSGWATHTRASTPHLWCVLISN